MNVSPDDLSHVGAYSDESAAITLEEWEVNVAKQKGNRKPWPGTLPDDVWKSLSAARPPRPPRPLPEIPRPPRPGPFDSPLSCVLLSLLWGAGFSVADCTDVVRLPVVEVLCGLFLDGLALRFLGLLVLDCIDITGHCVISWS